MVIHLDDYRKSPRRLTRSELACVRSYDPRLNRFDAVQLADVLLAQARHDVFYTLHPLYNAAIIPLPWSVT